MKMKSSFWLSKKCRSCTKIALVAKATRAPQQRTTISIQSHSCCCEKQCSMGRKILLIILRSLAWARPRRAPDESQPRVRERKGSPQSSPRGREAHPRWAQGCAEGCFLGQLPHELEEAQHLTELWLLFQEQQGRMAQTLFPEVGHPSHWKVYCT